MSQPPEPLRPKSQALLDAYRAQRAMPADARARIRERLETGGDEAAAPAPQSRWRWAALGGALAAAVVAALVIRGDRAGFQEEQARQSEAQLEAVTAGAESTAHVASPGRSRARPDTATPPASASPPDANGASTAASPPRQAIHPGALDGIRDGAQPSTPPTPRMRSNTRPQPQPRPAPPPASETVTPTPSTLGEENRLISAAWRHVTAKALGQASVVIDAHEARFPAGVLAPERRALRVIVGCLGGTASTNAADVFASRHPRSPLLKKVREACPAAPSAGSKKKPRQK